MEEYNGMSNDYYREINELDQDVDNFVVDNTPELGNGRVEFATKNEATGNIDL